MKLNFPKTYIAWDLETSGLDPERNKILEIGAMLVKDGEIALRKSWILDNGIEIPEEITQLTGITNEIIKAEGRNPADCLKEFLEMLGPGFMPNLTHNGIRFDIPFLCEQIKQILSVPGFPYIDTQRIQEKLYRTAIDTAVIMKAKKLDLDRDWNESFFDFANRVMEIRAYGVKYNVGVCCEDLGIDRTGITQHRALGDVELTNQIYKKLTQPAPVVVA